MSKRLKTLAIAGALALGLTGCQTGEVGTEPTATETTTEPTAEEAEAETVEPTDPVEPEPATEAAPFEPETNPVHPACIAALAEAEAMIVGQSQIVGYMETTIDILTEALTLAEQGDWDGVDALQGDFEAQMHGMESMAEAFPDGTAYREAADACEESY